MLKRRGRLALAGAVVSLCVGSFAVAQRPAGQVVRVELAYAAPGAGPTPDFSPYPTIVVLDSSGTQLKRVSGYQSSKAMLTLLR